MSESGEKSPKCREEPRVLDPDNPLLEKFQKTLKEHLLRQIDHLKEDIFEYECGIKKNNSKREELGVFAYEQQQIVEKQQSMLDSYVAKLQTTQAAREELENVLGEKREAFKRERAKLQEAEAKEVQLRGEIEGANLLIHQMSQWEGELESDISVKKRISEKIHKDKAKLLGEKRQQDGLIYRLMTRIWQLQGELERMDMQIRVKEEERERMAQTVALGNTNVEAMEAEYRCLMHSWNSVIIAIGNRDKVLSCLHGELGKVEEKFKNILSEIEQIKKLTQKEMKRNESITNIKTRFTHDIQNCKTALDAELAKKASLEKKMDEMHLIIEQTDFEIQKIADEAHGTTTILGSLQREYSFLNKEKVEIEERIMTELEEQVTSNKTAKIIQRALKLLKTKNCELEIHVATMENKSARVLTEIESQKYANAESQRFLAELKEKVRGLSKEADAHQEGLKKLEFIIGKRQREVDLLNNKYQRMCEKTGLMVAVSPLEAKLVVLEKNIEEVLDENKKLQQFWLREQTNLLKISQQRQDQIQNNNLLRKQTLILEQKNLRLTDELEKYKKQQDRITRNINNLHNQLTVMGDNFCKTRGLKVAMDKDNDVLRQDYVNRLKEAELDCLRLQAEIAQIEEDKINCSNELLEINRQSLEWEKKFLSAKEAKSIMIEERGKDGEVGSMKAEIHRMNVRYSQLKKVQDVLVQDLEHCIARRDAILTVSEAREKRYKNGMEKTRCNFQRKLDDMRNKTRQMEGQIDDISMKVEEMEKQMRGLERDIEQVEREIREALLVYAGIEEEMEDAMTQRQMNFEMLLQTQKKLNCYTDLSKGRKPHLMYRSESSMAIAFNKEKETNGKLLKIIENLLGDFPNHKHELDRIGNTLRLPVYLYYQ